MRIITKIVVFMLLAIASPGVIYASSSIPAFYNNNNNLIVPLRSTLDELGVTVGWDDQSKAVVISQGSKDTTFSLANPEYYFTNGQQKQFAVFPRNIGGTTLVSISFILELLELEVVAVEQENGLLLKKLEDKKGHLYDLQFSMAPVDKIYSFSSDNVQKAPVLMYHEVTDIAGRNFGPYLSLVVEPHTFCRQLDWLQENNFSTVTLKELYEHWYEGRPIRENPVVLSFDDGFCNMYEIVLPELEKRDMVATFFVYTEAVGGERHLNKDMLKTMIDKGMEIGSHSYSHDRLTAVDESSLENELFASKRILEDVIEQDVQFFSYPFGSYNADIINRLIEYSYAGAVTTREEVAAFYHGRYQLPRLKVAYEDALAGFVGKMEPFIQ